MEMNSKLAFNPISASIFTSDEYPALLNWLFRLRRRDVRTTTICIFLLNFKQSTVPSQASPSHRQENLRILNLQTSPFFAKIRYTIFSNIS